MDKWVVSYNGIDRYYDTFQDAVECFRSEIRRFVGFIDKELFIGDPLPFDAGCFFSYKSDESTITDEEIVVWDRLQTLLGSMHIRKSQECSDYCSNKMRKSINYHGAIEEFGEELDIRIIRSEDEIKAEIKHQDGEEETFVITNAFIFRDDQKIYYYKTHQVIRATNVKDDYLLGTRVDLDLSLKRMEEEDISNEVAKNNCMMCGKPFSYEGVRQGDKRYDFLLCSPPKYGEKRLHFYFCSKCIERATDTIISMCKTDPVEEYDAAAGFDKPDFYKN